MIETKERQDIYSMFFLSIIAGAIFISVVFFITPLYSDISIEDKGHFFCEDNNMEYIDIIYLDQVVILKCNNNNKEYKIEGEKN